MTSGNGIPSKRFSLGERVVVVDGTFDSLEGIILTPDAVLARYPQVPISREFERGKVCAVLLTLFGKQVPVELELWQVRRAPLQRGQA
jgi:transcription antitermination factor NusG